LRDAAGRSSGPHGTPVVLQWIAMGQVGDAHQVCASTATQNWRRITGVPVFPDALAARARTSPAPPQAPARASYTPPPPVSAQGVVAAAAPKPPGGRLAGTMAVPSLMEADILALRALPQAAAAGGGGPGRGRTMYGQMAFGGPG